MASKFRAASFYHKGRRLKFATTGQVTYTHNGESVVIEDGYENESQGPITSEASLDSAVPIGGDGSSIDDDFVEGDEVEVSFAMLNGKIHTIKPMTIKTMAYNWDHSNSTQTRAMTLKGGKPKITG